MEKQFGTEILAQCPCGGNMFWADSVHNAIRCEKCGLLMVGLAAHKHIADFGNVEKLDNTWGGKRLGAGRPKSEGKGEEWQQGYQAGYKARKNLNDAAIALLRQAYYQGLSNDWQNKTHAFLDKFA